MKKSIIAALLLVSAFAGMAQDDSEKKGFKKENLFSGGSVSLSFFNNAFLIGGSPVFGYRLGRFADAGLVANFTYSSQRDYSVFDDRLRQTQYGGGAFARLYPLNFLFGQLQWEYNFTHVKYQPANNSGILSFSDNISGHSLLVGGGYASGRSPQGNSPFFYMSVLWDISDNKSSPYKDAYGRSIPIIRAGFNIPLFQGGGRGF